MKNFFRAVRLALRHRLTICCVVLTSLSVACFWGANIGTIYPVVEVVFEGQSLHDWIERRVSVTEAEVVQHQLALDQFRSQQQGAVSGSDQSLEALALQEQLVGSTQVLQWYRWSRPYILRFTPSSPFQTLLFLIGALVLGTIVKNIFLVINLILVERLAQLATFDLQKQFYRRTLRMDLGAFGEDRTPRLLSRFTNDMGSLTGGVATLFGKVLREPLKMTACLVGAGMISWRLLMVSLIISPLAIVLMARLAQSIKRANRRAMEDMSQLYSVLCETFTGIQAVKAYTMESYERGRFHQIAKKYFRKAMRIITYNALARPTLEIMGMSMISMAIIAGGYLVLNQQVALLGVKISDRPLTLAPLITFFALLIGSIDPARKMADVFQSLQRSAAGADRIYELLDREPAIVELDNPKPIPGRIGELTFQDVHFRYTNEQPVLRGVNLRVRAGETIAIVGPNGCGKSTLANLIPRFYDPADGAIFLGGVDLRQVRLRDLRGRIGIVTQQTLLFDDTIMNNIRYGSPGASDIQVVEAARQARADLFIERQLEQGYQTVVGESGGKLSGGQRQRIALARAMLRDPELMILDEATSQIDVESEQLIHQALRSFLAERTGILITHRFSTLELVDRIVVMDGGVVLDAGSHDELLARCDLFRRLYHATVRTSA